MAKDPYKNSPYDAAGMPLGAEAVDYDKKEDVAQKTVTDKYVEPLPLFSDDDEFQEKHIKRRQYNEALNNTAIQLPGHKIHKAHEEDIASGLTDITDPPAKVDLEDPAAMRKEVVEDSLDKGIEVPKLPEAAKQEDVDKVLKGETNTDNADDITTAEGVKAEEDVNTLDRHNDPADPDFMELLKDTDNDGK